MMTLRQQLMCILHVLLVSSTVAAQSPSRSSQNHWPPGIQRGTPVRLITIAGTFQGRYIGVFEDSLKLARNDTTHSFARARIAEILVRRRMTRRGAVTGVIVGAALGAALGLATKRVICAEPSNACTDAGPFAASVGLTGGRTHGWRVGGDGGTPDHAVEANRSLNTARGARRHRLGLPVSTPRGSFALGHFFRRVAHQV